MSIRRFIAVPAITVAALAGLGVASAGIASAQTSTGDNVTSVQFTINNGFNKLQLTGKSVDMTTDGWVRLEEIDYNTRIVAKAQANSATRVTLDYDVIDYSGTRTGHVTLTEADGYAYATTSGNVTATGRAVTDGSQIKAEFEVR